MLMINSRRKHMKAYMPFAPGEPNIVVVGGGTGLSTMLRGLKRYTGNLTAIVTVSDDGEAPEFFATN
jgi:NADPH:quinone reductase-like Zn-dependent oxidoreductase